MRALADGSGSMFDRIAPRYDLLNRLISLGLDRGWRRRLVAEVCAGAPSRVLDVATGTADVALAIAGQDASRRVRVTGIDPSAQMLAVGRRKVARAGRGAQVELRLGDAQQLPLADDSVDAACICFGIRNVPDRAAAAREMARVTRPGGHLAVLELGEPRGGPMAAAARWHVHHVVPAVGGWLSGEAEYRYLPASIAAFPRPEVFAALLQAAGWTAVSVEPFAWGAAHLFVGRSAGAKGGHLTRCSARSMSDCSQ